MKIVCCSDTHGQHRNIEIPNGDMFIFAGDFEIRNVRDLWIMSNWLNELPHKYVVTIFGNHDFTDDMDIKDIKWILGNKVNYLCNDSVTIEGLKIWGSSYSPYFNNWAWMQPDNMLKEIWDKIPRDTNIVVTHCPPYGILDGVLPNMESVGSLTLKDKLKEIHPRIHIAGHLHESYGKYTDGKTDYYNVSVLDAQYQVANLVTIIEG